MSKFKTVSLRETVHYVEMAGVFQDAYRSVFENDSPLLNTPGTAPIGFVAMRNAFRTWRTPHTRGELWASPKFEANVAVSLFYMSVHTAAVLSGDYSGFVSRVNRAVFEVKHPMLHRMLDQHPLPLSPEEYRHQMEALLMSWFGVEPIAVPDNDVEYVSGMDCSRYAAYLDSRLDGLRYGPLLKDTESFETETGKVRRLTADEAPSTGDLVVYCMDGESRVEVLHVGLVSSVVGEQIMIDSKFGFGGGVFRGDIHSQLISYGQSVRFFRVEDLV